MKPGLVTGLLAVLTLSGCAGGPDTTADAETRGDQAVPTIVVPDCEDDSACAAGFSVEDTWHDLACYAADPEKVTDRVLAAGNYDGVMVEMRALAGVDTDVMAALSLDGDDCGEGDNILSPWSLVYPDLEASESDLRAAFCIAAAEELRTPERCE